MENGPITVFSELEEPSKERLSRETDHLILCGQKLIYGTRIPKNMILIFLHTYNNNIHIHKFSEWAGRANETTRHIHECTFYYFKLQDKLYT